MESDDASHGPGGSDGRPAQTTQADIQRLQDELHLRREELRIADRRLALEERGLHGKGISEWRTALISVLATLITAAATFGAAYKSGYFDVEKATIANSGSLDLAKLQFSNELIKTALASNNRANSLLFYADIGLLSGLKSEEVKKYAMEENERITQRKPGQSLLPSFADLATNQETLWIDDTLIRSISPKANPQIVTALTTIGNYILTGFEINKNKQRLAMFLGQTAHETGGFAYLATEEGNYSAQRLAQIYSKQFTEETAKAYAHNAEKLFNRLYADRMGNGPESSGDGFRFRGRGYLGITGRANYENASKLLRVDLAGNPDLLSDPYVGLLFLAAYWHSRGLNEVADSGDVRQLTLKIVGGPAGLDSRTNYTQLAMRALEQRHNRPPATTPKR